MSCGGLSGDAQLGPGSVDCEVVPSVGESFSEVSSPSSNTSLLSHLLTLGVVNECHSLLVISAQLPLRGVNQVLTWHLDMLTSWYWSAILQSRSSE